MSYEDNSYHFELSSSPTWMQSSETRGRAGSAFGEEDASDEEVHDYSYEDPVFSSNFFAEIRTEDEEERKVALQGIIAKLKASATGKTEESRKLIRSLLDSVVRLCSDCPYPDVREGLGDFLLSIDQILPGVRRSQPSPVTSLFIPAAEIPGPSPDNAEVRALFVNSYLDTGRLTHFERVLGFHPDYLRRFHDLNREVLDGEGSLPIVWRYYISIIAASQHNCQYLVYLQEERYLLAGGDPTWLKGVDFGPKKLAALVEINAILAHQPWTLGNEHIEALTKGADTWSIPELVHAIIILSIFHSLAGFIWGLGITPEADLEVISHRRVYVAEEKDMSAVIKNTSDLLEKLQLPREDELDAEEEREKAFETLENECWIPETPPPEESAILRGDMTRYTKKASPTRYHDFDVHSKEYSVFRITDYSWSEHGIALMQKFNTFWEPLDDLFSFTFRMTSYTLGENSGVDTQPVRLAVWYYVHRVFGVFHDDYNYRHVNEFLNVPIKNYIKKVVCSPESVSLSDVAYFGYNFSSSEKCHVNLLLMEARKQVELLYGLHRVMEYMQR